MTKYLLCMLSCGLLITTLAKAETVLYCQDELTTGIAEKDGLWITGDFELEHHTVIFNDDFTRAEGLTLRPMECKTPLAEQYPDLVNCISSYGSYETFNYDKKLRRYTFSAVSNFGYVLGGTPSVTETLHAGTCTSF